MLTKKNSTFFLKPLSQIEETEDIVGLHNGNEQVIHNLYSIYYKPLCYFCDSLINNKTESEDIAVEIFLKFIKKRTDFDNFKDIKGFLFTAAKNSCFDYLRKIKRTAQLRKGLTFVSQHDEITNENEMVTARLLQTIYQEIDNLPGQCRRIFKSFFFNNKTTAEIAVEMSISPQTVLNQKAKALRILRITLLKESLIYAFVYITSRF